jgi:hypothetical protein
MRLQSVFEILYVVEGERGPQSKPCRALIDTLQIADALISYWNRETHNPGEEVYMVSITAMS